MSAKVRVPFLRQVVPISKKVARDPRFDDLSGEYNPEVFDKTYQFLDDIRAREKELVKKQLKKHRSGEEHEKLQHLLQRMEQQEMAQKERKRQQELRLALKQERRAQAQQGHRPYFLKKSEQRQLVLAEKFKELITKQEARELLESKEAPKCRQGQTTSPFEQRVVRNRAQLCCCPSEKCICGDTFGLGLFWFFPIQR